jgi:hypothetical protein
VRFLVGLQRQGESGALMRRGGLDFIDTLTRGKYILLGIPAGLLPASASPVSQSNVHHAVAVASKQLSPDLSPRDCLLRDTRRLQ